MLTKPRCEVDKRSVKRRGAMIVNLSSSKGIRAPPGPPRKGRSKPAYAQPAPDLHSGLTTWKLEIAEPDLASCRVYFVTFVSSVAAEFRGFLCRSGAKSPWSLFRFLLPRRLTSVGYPRRRAELFVLRVLDDLANMDILIAEMQD